MHIIPEWDGTWVRQKVACFKVWGEKTYTRLFERDFPVVYGNAFFDSTDGGVPRILPTCYKEKRRSPSDLERANAGAPRVGPTTHWSEFQDRQPAAHSNFDRSLSLATLVSGTSLPAWSAITSAMRFKICFVDVDPRPSAEAGQDQNTHMVGIYTIE